MPFFPVDDDFPFSRKAIAAGNAAVGLWARAGGFCMKEATDGIIRREELTGLGTLGQASKLVEVRLWHAHGHDCPRCQQPPKGGWIFHDWTDVGTVKTGEEIKARREADRIRQRKHRARQREEAAAGSHGVTNTVTNGVTHGPPSPSPSSVVTEVSQSPTVTRDHGLTDDELANIETRLGCDRGHAERVARLVMSKVKPGVTVARRGRYVLRAIDSEPDLYRPAKRNRAQDQCPTHPGNPAHNCGGCKTDAIVEARENGGA